MAGLKKGTKLTDNPKDFILRVRIDAITLSKLDECCKHAVKTRSYIVRSAIEKQYQEIKK